jgi:hypothetical protein
MSCVKKPRIIISLCLAITIIFSSTIYVNATPLLNDQSIVQSLNSDELKAYQKSIDGTTDDPDFNYSHIINEANMDINTNVKGMKLIDSEYQTTSILQSNSGNVKNYEAYIFVQETFKEEGGGIIPFATLIEEDHDDSVSVRYVIKFNYDRISTPRSGMRPNYSEFKVVSTNSGVQVGKASIKQRVWGTVYNTQTGKSHASASYSRDVNITNPQTGTDYNRVFTSPRHYYYDTIATGQCGFGVILTLHRANPNNYWLHSTGFLGHDGGLW